MLCIIETDAYRRQLRAVKYLNVLVLYNDDICPLQCFTPGNDGIRKGQCVRHHPAAAHVTHQSKRKSCTKVFKSPNQSKPWVALAPRARAWKECLRGHKDIQKSKTFLVLLRCFTQTLTAMHTTVQGKMLIPFSHFQNPL